MDRSDVPEFHYITPISNVSSILRRGLLCHRYAQRLKPASIAWDVMQAKRATKRVPNAMPLHDYVNLFFHARNPMMYMKRSMHGSLAVVCVSTDVLDLDGVVLTNGNAAGDYTRYLPSPSGLSELNKALVFADDWTDPDFYEYLRKKSAKLTEVLVPRNVDPRYIVRAHVSCSAARGDLQSAAPELPTNITPQLFFMKGE